MQVHDKACMRMRSLAAELAGGDHISRARSSKIQNQDIRVVIGSSEVPFYTELVALMRKDAATIAASLFGPLADLVNVLARGLESPSPFRLVHLLVGDGIPTNYAAARRVFVKMEQAQLSVQYNLILFRCSAHQANLTVVVAICAELLPRPLEQNPICAACSRLYKHLLVDYAEEFSLSLRVFLSRHIELRPPAAENREELRKLQALYGDVVVPEDIVGLCNVALGTWQHACDAGTSREEVCAKAHQVLHRLIILVEEKPIVTRFFLFANCVHTLLLMRLLQLPSSIFNTGAVQPRQENGKRLQRYKQFHEDPTMLNCLRTASLCLQLTQHATALACQEHGPAPALQVLGSGEIQRRTSEHLQHILPRLVNDPGLPLAETVLALWTTESHICIRFRMFKQWPYKIWSLSKTFNPSGYLSSLQDFLQEDEASPCFLPSPSVRSVV